MGKNSQGHQYLSPNIILSTYGTPLKCQLKKDKIGFGGIHLVGTHVVSLPRILHSLSPVAEPHPACIFSKWMYPLSKT